MDIRIKLNPQYEQLRPYVEHLAQTGELHGEIVHRGRNSLYRLTVEGVDLVVKSFSHMTVANRFIYAHLRKSKAVRSYDNAVRIAQLGLLTPDPIASIDVIQYGNLRRGYYICRYVDAQKTTRWYERPDGKELETILATYIYGLRSMGVWHRDLNPGNILRDRQGNLFLIDLNRISFGNTS
ncbi:MAG: hypothetical protein IJ808_06625, partial [Muribaculaceae bacterium]|nr:hypothetical protein [Muribaculaceae bacterium]